jgi:hypothetical protein
MQREKQQKVKIRYYYLISGKKYHKVQCNEKKLIRSPIFPVILLKKFKLSAELLDTESRS